VQEWAVVQVWATTMRLAVKIILGEELVLQDTTLMSSKCLSNKSMSSRRCGERSASSLSTVEVEVMEGDRLRGKVCMTMCHNPMCLQMGAGVADFKVVKVEATEVQHLLTQPKLLLPMHQPDRKMLVSQVPIIAVVGEVVSVVSILMLEAE